MLSTFHVSLVQWWIVHSWLVSPVYFHSSTVFSLFLQTQTKRPSMTFQAFLSMAQVLFGIFTSWRFPTCLLNSTLGLFPHPLLPGLYTSCSLCLETHCTFSSFSSLYTHTRACVHAHTDTHTHFYSYNIWSHPQDPFPAHSILSALQS